MDQLTLKRVPIGLDQSQEDYDVLAGGAVVGRIFLNAAAFEGRQWGWTLAYCHHEDRAPTHGYESTREAAITAFAKSWRRWVGRMGDREGEEQTLEGRKVGWGVHSWGSSST